MKLSIFLLAVLAVAGHHGANAQCQCDCTCPSTEQTTCNPDTTTELTTTTSSTSTTTTTTSTSTSSTSSTTSTSTSTTSTSTTSTTSTSTTSTSTTSTTTTTPTTTSTTSTSTTSTSTTSTSTTSTTSTSTSTTSTSTTSTTSTSTTSTSTTSTSTTTTSTTSTSTSTSSTSSSTTSTSTTTTTPRPTTTSTTSTTAKPTTITTATTTTVVPTTTPIPAFDCGTYTVDVGNQVPMQSENYPDKYYRKSKCTWELTCSDPAGVWDVSCDDFKTEDAESGEECSDADYVKVKDNTGTLGEFCGTDGPDLTTNDNYLKFVFKTDKDSVKKSGFSCKAVCSVPTTAAAVAQSTETPVGGYSGVCSLEWTAAHGETVTWESPDYDGIDATYPEGDYCCWLNVTIPDTYSMFMVTMNMESPSRIYETGSCVGDKITYMASAGTSTTLCGDLSGQAWAETAIMNTPLSFGFQWCSDETDGGRDIGFRMTIVGHDFMQGK